MIKLVLKKALENQTLVGIRTNLQNWGESIIGFICEINDLNFTLREINEYGSFEVNTIIKFTDVLNIDINDRYQKRLLFLYKNNSNFNTDNEVTIWKEGNLLKQYLLILLKNKNIVTFYFNEEDYIIGQIIEYNKDYLLIKNIGREGDEDGLSYNLVDKLIGIRYNGIEEQKIKLLYENNYFFYN